RPPSVTSPDSCPCRTAVRCGSCLPRGPTTSTTSSSISSTSTPSPTPTLNASSPSFAEPTSSPSASCTRGGKASSSCPTCFSDTVLTAAPPVSTTSTTRHGRRATGRGGRTATSKFYDSRDNLGGLDQANNSSN